MAHIEQDGQRQAVMASARDQELRLILDEERAERRVARAKVGLEKACLRLERAERRVDRRTRRLKDAEAELALCQQRRALGPSPAPSDAAGETRNASEPVADDRVNATGDEPAGSSR